MEAWKSRVPYTKVGSRWVGPLVSCNTHVKSSLHLAAWPDREERCRICFGDNYLMRRPVWTTSMQGKSGSFVAYLRRVGIFNPVGFSTCPWLVARFTSKPTLNPCCRSSAALRTMPGRSPMSWCATFCSDLHDARSRTMDCVTGTEVIWMLCA